MNFDFFIAKRYLKTNGAGFSKPIVRLAVFSVFLGLTAMIVSVAVVSGFKSKVREKVTGFSAHILISPYDLNMSYKTMPFKADSAFISDIYLVKGVGHVQVVAGTTGIIKTEDEIEGVILKGIGRDFDWTYFNDKMTDGNAFELNDTIASDAALISRTTAGRLNLKTGDTFRMYFILNDEPVPRGRKFTISGIFHTGLEDFDRLYVLCDIRQIRKLNNWKEDEASAVEVFLSDFRDLDKVAAEMYQATGRDTDIKTVKELYPQIFDWLDLHDMNAIVIIVLMLCVSGITMISTLLVLILERTNMIGILKALGAENRNIRNIMLLNAFYIIGKGMLWGNLAGAGLCYLQMTTGFLKLDQESYYVATVPVEMSFGNLFLLNLTTFIFCSFLLVLPSYIVARIAPIKVIRFG
ncbi:MAG: ABC transporter permease [Bacteroidales bacterium]|nr:ABC transporter permease [Bacteroidales bacterium]